MGQVLREWAARRAAGTAPTMALVTPRDRHASLWCGPPISPSLLHAAPAPAPSLHIL